MILPCHVPSYILKGYKIVQDVKPGGIFLLNCQWTPEEVERHLPNSVKKYIAKNNIQFYTVNAIDKAREIGMGKRTNTILQSAFFALAKVMPSEQAIQSSNAMMPGRWAYSSDMTKKTPLSASLCRS